ncbi:thioeseterase [Defluviimonas sp. 20V17]|uniref:Acyl-CoA thioesterase FadM n=1 Tax=Allgaiera indica TaxID=765699 RepID=A0AAN4UMF3_9RHOB|nr:acyl-CoA thioesterase [Allgaiera indica]KDB03460.1 thioeseterase [Defluviimonas sp. 20V17]GHD98172.1 thioeseterase [Allgaiera indica]SDW52368.1 Acyl-CoA thioesterase FadM [Allgaiera indica]
MYPIFRLAREMLAQRKAPALGAFDVHVSYHRCWPWDLDPWMELNNGRTLTLYDLGRIPFAVRTGLVAAMRRNGWGMTVAGAAVRYRRRIRAFRRFQMRSRALGWDTRFLYLEQSIWFGEDCANQILIRTAVTGRDGIVAPSTVARALGLPEESPPLPRWVTAWIEAEAERPWPPER